MACTDASVTRERPYADRLASQRDECDVCPRQTGGQADRDLAASRGSAREQEIRDIDGSSEQDEADGPGRQIERDVR